MNAEAIMTPGGIAAGFQGLINAAMNIPLQMRQQRMQEHAQDMERARMSMAFENMKRDDAFRQQQADLAESRWRAQQTFDKNRAAATDEFHRATLGLQRDAENRAKTHDDRMYEISKQTAADQHQRAIHESASHAQKLQANQLGMVEHYGPSSAVPTGRVPVTEAFKDYNQTMNSMVAGLDPSRTYAPGTMGASQAFGRKQQDLEIDRQKKLADIEYTKSQADWLKRRQPGSTSTRGPSEPKSLTKFKEHRNNVYSRSISPDVTPEERLELEDQIRELDAEIDRLEGRKTGAAAPASWSDLTNAYTTGNPHH
jgi:hypothetical protein